jgi:hypothetical protein
MRTLLASKDIPHRKLVMTDGRVRKVHEMECSKCDFVGEWVDPAWHGTIPQKVLNHFRRLGWGIGRDRGQDICPGCMAIERDARVQAKVVRMQPDTALVKVDMLPVNNAPRAPPPPIDLMAETPPQPLPSLPPAEGQKTPRRRKAHTPIYAPVIPGKKHQPFYTRGFSNRTHALYSALGYFRQAGVESPKPDRDYRLVEAADGWGWERVFKPAAETPPPNIEENPMPEPDLRVVPPEPTSQADGPNREQRRIIRRHIEENYDQDAQRWRGDLSDEKVGRHFAIPTAWVTQVREDGDYGPDVNEAAKDITKEIGDLEGLRDLLTQAIEALKAKAH